MLKLTVNAIKATVLSNAAQGRWLMDMKAPSKLLSVGWVATLGLVCERTNRAGRITLMKSSQ
jgi:hypothetical protein